MTMMQNEVLSMMKNNIKTNKNYLDGYMETFEKGNVICEKNEAIAEQIDMERLNARCEEMYETTHMAGNPIYSLKKEQINQDDEIERKMVRNAKAYNRAKTNKQTRENIQDALSEEEIDALSM